MRKRRWFWEAVTRFLVTAVVVAIAWYAPWSGVDPAQWGDLAIGLGLRPPEHVASGWWHWGVRTLAAHLSLDELEQTLRLAGIVGIGLVTFMAFGLLDRLRPYGLRVDLRERTLGRLVVNLILALGTLAFASSDTVWRACQGAGVLLAEILVLLLVVRLVFGFLVWGGNARVLGASVLLGLMAGDGVFGVIAFVALWALVMYKALRNPDAKVNPLADPTVRHYLVMSMTLLFLTAATTMLVIDYRLYGAFGGLQQSKVALVDFAIVVFGDLYRNAKEAMGVLGWVLAFLFAVGPAVLAFVSLPKVMYDDRLPSRRYALALTLSGLVAWTQVSPFPILWAQTWLPATEMSNELVKVMMSLLGVVTLVWSFGAFFLMGAFLNFRTIVGYQYEDASSGTAATRAIGAMTRFNKGLLALALVLLTGALVVVWPFGRQAALGRMRAVVGDYCREVVRECAGVSVVLTDGALDEGVELAAARAGQTLVAVSMLSGKEDHPVRIRQRAAVDDRERELLKLGGFDALSYWRTEATNRLAEVALQFGFERRVLEAETSPTVLSGLVGRQAGGNRAEAVGGAARARRLGDRVLAICESEHVDWLAGGRLTELFRFVQWRISQMCRVRLGHVDAKTWGPGERKDEALNARLDELNPILVELKGRLGENDDADGLRLSPEEGLAIALRRADFRLAKTFAATVIRQKPRDVRAHFALGMYHLVNEEYRSCIPFFERILEMKGENATVLNNLATAYDRLGDRERALGYAERAHKAAPDNQVIQENLDRLRK